MDEDLDALITDRVIPVGTYKFEIPNLFISSACIQSVSEGMRQPYWPSIPKSLKLGNKQPHMWFLVKP
jgi:hypothetical protein